MKFLDLWNFLQAFLFGSFVVFHTNFMRFHQVSLGVDFTVEMLTRSWFPEKGLVYPLISSTTAKNCLFVCSSFLRPDHLRSVCFEFCPPCTMFHSCPRNTLLYLAVTYIVEQLQVWDQNGWFLQGSECPYWLWLWWSGLQVTFQIGCPFDSWMGKRPCLNESNVDQ